MLQEANVILGQTVRSSALPQQREVAERWGAVVFIALRKQGRGLERRAAEILCVEPERPIAPPRNAFCCLQANEVAARDLVKDAPDLGMAFYIALLSAILGRQIGARLVVLGQMSLHGVLSRVDGLGDKLRVAMDAGAQRVLIPTENSRDFATLPAEVLEKLRVEFYSEPAQAAFKALAE